MFFLKKSTHFGVNPAILYQNHYIDRLILNQFIKYNIKTTCSIRVL